MYTKNNIWQHTMLESKKNRKKERRREKGKRRRAKEGKKDTLLIGMIR